MNPGLLAAALLVSAGRAGLADLYERAASRVEESAQASGPEAGGDPDSPLAEPTEESAYRPRPEIRVQWKKGFLPEGEVGWKRFWLRRDQGETGIALGPGQVRIGPKRFSIGARAGPINLRYRQGKEGRAAAVRFSLGSNAFGVGVSRGGVAVAARTKRGWVHFNHKTGVSVSANAGPVRVRTALRKKEGVRIGVATRGRSRIRLNLNTVLR